MISTTVQKIEEFRTYIQVENVGTFRIIIPASTEKRAERAFQKFCEHIRSNHVKFKEGFK